MASAINTKLVFCPPPLGKPDPKEERPINGADTRKRVVQLGTKDNTCWYYVFNQLRNRFKAPNTENLEARKFEKLASERRKNLSKHERSLPNIADQLDHPLVIKNLTPITRRMAKERAGTRVMLATVFSIPESLTKQFIEQDKCLNFYDFLVHLKFATRSVILEVFLKRLGLEPKTLFEQFQKEEADLWKGTLEGKSWEQLDVRQKSPFLDRWVRRVSAEKYGIVTSTWQPSDSFESFCAELEKHGPIAVSGWFGQICYQVPATKMDKQINGRDLFYWKKTDPVNEGNPTAHMILLVGAEKSSARALVYFIDPNDDSDPAHPEKQKIYTMSYERLTSPKHLTDTAGCMRENAPRSVGYAWCSRQTSASAPKEQKEQKADGSA